LTIFCLKRKQTGDVLKRIEMMNKLRTIASAGSMDKILKDSSGKLRSFPEVMHDFHSWDARMFVANTLKDCIDKLPQSLLGLPPELQEKARELLAIEIVSKFCESAEDLAAFSILARILTL
jgi:hypothetical protein